MHSCKFVCSGLADSQILNTAISLFFHLINWILRNVHVAPLMGTCTFSFESRVANTSTPASTHSQNPSGTVGSGSDGDAKCWLIHLRPSQMPAQCGGDKPIADMSSNALPLPCPHPSDTLQSEVFIVAISSAFSTRQNARISIRCN